MDTKEALLTSLSIGFCLAMEASDFVNLDFSNPDLSSLKYNATRDAFYGTPSEVIPGWAISQNGVPINTAWVNNRGGIDPVTLLIVPTQTPNVNQYTVMYLGVGLGVDKATTFSQNGTIPAGSQTFHFHWSGGTTNPDSPLFINGEIVAVSFNPETPYYYTANVSRWSGEAVELSFRFPIGNSALSELSFNVPEPSTWILGCFGLGVIALLGRWTKLGHPSPALVGDAPRDRPGTGCPDLPGASS